MAQDDGFFGGREAGEQNARGEHRVLLTFFVLDGRVTGAYSLLKIT